MFLAARMPVRAAGNTRVAALSTSAPARLSPVLSGHGRVHLPRHHQLSSCQQRRTAWIWNWWASDGDKFAASPHPYVPFTGPPPTPLARTLRAQDPYDRIWFARPSSNFGTNGYGRKEEAVEAVCQALDVSERALDKPVTRHLVPFWTVTAVSDVGYKFRGQRSRQEYGNQRIPTRLYATLAAVGKDHWAYGAMLFSDSSEFWISRSAENTTTAYLEDRDRVRCRGGQSALGDEDLDSAPSPFVLGPPPLDRRRLQKLMEYVYILRQHGFKHKDFHQQIVGERPAVWETFTVDREPVVYSVPHYRLIYKTEYRGQKILVDATARSGDEHHFDEHAIALMLGWRAVPTDGQRKGHTWTPALDSNHVEVVESKDGEHYTTGVLASDIPMFHTLLANSMATRPRWVTDDNITPYNVDLLGDKDFATKTSFFQALEWSENKLLNLSPAPPPRWTKPASTRGTPPQPDADQPNLEPSTEGGSAGATAESTSNATAGRRKRGKDRTPKKESPKLEKASVTPKQESPKPKQDNSGGGEASEGPTLRPQTARDQRREASTPKKPKESGAGGGRAAGAGAGAGTGAGGTGPKPSASASHRLGRAAHLQQRLAAKMGAQARLHTPLAGRAKLQAAAAQRPRPVTVKDTKGYYAELEVEPTPDWLDRSKANEVDAIIKNQKIKLIKQFHPDRSYGHAMHDDYNERTQRITHASDIIKDLKGRLEYQAGRAR